MKYNITQAGQQSVHLESTNEQIFFSIIQKIGSYDRYQRITIIFWSVIIFLCGQLLFSLPFLLYQQSYTCDGLDISGACQDYVCSLPEKQRIYFIPTGRIHSLADQLGDYRCPSQYYKLNNIMSLAYFGLVIGYFLLSLFGETISKKIVMVTNLLSFIVGVILVLSFPNSEIIVVVGLMLGVLGSSNCYIVTFMFLIQTVQKQLSSLLSVIIQAFYGFGAVATIISYWIISDWRLVFIYCYLVPSVILLISMCCILVDTPMSLIIRNTPQVAYQNLAFIARMNKRDKYLTLDCIKEARERYFLNIKKTQIKKVSIIQIFKYRSTRNITLLLIIVQCSVTFQFYAPSLMIDTFHFDIFISGFVLSIPQVISSLFSLIVVKKIKRRIVNYVCFGCAFLSSFTLLFIWNQNETEDQQNHQFVYIAVMVLIFIFQYAVSTQYTAFYIYVNEVFPTQARMLAISCISLIGGLATSAAPLIIGLCFNKEFPIMIVFTSVSALCIFITVYLPETFGQQPQEIIKQLKQANETYTSQNQDLLARKLND